MLKPHSLALLAVLLGNLPTIAAADQNELSWCRKAADTFVDSAYKRDENGELDDGVIEGKVLESRVNKSLLDTEHNVSSQILNRTLYLRSQTKLTQSEARADVYALCASLTSRYGDGNSHVSYGTDVGSDAIAQKEAAWHAYYRPRAACDSPADWDATVACGNERMRARNTFDARWAKGELRGK